MKRHRLGFAALSSASTSRRRYAAAISSFSLLLALCANPEVRADEPTVEVFNQNNAAPSDNPVADVASVIPHVEVYTQFHAGYDDNTRTTANGRGALFTMEAITLAYHLPPRPLQLSLVARIGATDYLGQRDDINASIDLTLSRRLSRRLTLNLSLDAAYRSEPNFDENIGPNRFSGSYFSSIDKVWVNYNLTRRFASVSSYNVKVVRYDDEATALFIDRDEHTFGEQIRFSLSRTTVLTGDYRLLLIDYVTAPLDSITHFALVGIEHNFGRRLRAQLRGGVSFRSYDEGGDQTNPDFESSVDYRISRHTGLSWSGSYSVEQPTERSVVSRTTFRTGLQFSHSFTSRISSSLSLAYHHDENEQGLLALSNGPSFVEDTFDIGLRIRYQFNSRLAFDALIDHAEISSAQGNRNYSRNRYSLGVSLRF